MENLEKLGLIVNNGRIIDARFVEVPRQRNKKEENEAIKNGEIPKSFKENPKKLSHKDTDARWTKKITSTILVTKTTSRLIPKAKLLLNTRSQVPLCTILRLWRGFWAQMTRGRICTPTVHTRAKILKK